MCSYDKNYAREWYEEQVEKCDEIPNNVSTVKMEINSKTTDGEWV